MTRKFTLLVVALVFLIVAGVSASEKHDNDSDVVSGKKNYLPESSLTLVKLSHFTNLWHDATLKGDKNKVRQLENDILALIRVDINASHKFVDGQKTALKEGDKLRLLSYVKNTEDLQEFELLLKVKKRLVGSISKTSVFSNKYRLLGDYREILRREVDLTRFELVEETDDFIE